MTGGDYNKRDHGYAHENHVDMIQINTIPTRGDACLDVLYANFIHDIVELQTRQPLESAMGTRSDHDCVVAEFELNNFHIFKKKQITVRPRTKKGNMNFRNRLLNENWDSVRTAISATEKAEEMTSILMGYLDECFPKKTYTVKDSDDPWINMPIRKKIKKRNHEFKKHGKTEKWRNLDKQIKKMIVQAKHLFLQKGKEEAKKKNNSASYYRVVNCLKDGEAPKQFDLRGMNPEMSEKELANDLASFLMQLPQTMTLSRQESGP